MAKGKIWSEDEYIKNAPNEKEHLNRIKEVVNKDMFKGTHHQEKLESRLEQHILKAQLSKNSVPVGKRPTTRESTR